MKWSFRTLKMRNWRCWIPVSDMTEQEAAATITDVMLPKVGKVRDIAQLPSGNLLILIDAGSPNDGNEG